MLLLFLLLLVVVVVVVVLVVVVVVVVVVVLGVVFFARTVAMRRGNLKIKKARGGLSGGLTCVSRSRVSSSPYDSFCF